MAQIVVTIPSGQAPVRLMVRSPLSEIGHTLDIANGLLPGLRLALLMVLREDTDAEKPQPRP